MANSLQRKVKVRFRVAMASQPLHFVKVTASFVEKYRRIQEDEDLAITLNQNFFNKFFFFDKIIFSFLKSISLFEIGIFLSESTNENYIHHILFPRCTFLILLKLSQMFCIFQLQHPFKRRAGHIFLREHIGNNLCGNATLWNTPPQILSNY